MRSCVMLVNTGRLRFSYCLGSRRQLLGVTRQFAVVAEERLLANCLVPVGAERRLTLFLLSRLQRPDARVISRSDYTAKGAVPSFRLMPVASRRAAYAFLKGEY